MSVYEETQGIEYSFIDWMKTGVPIVILGVPIMALWLARGIKEVGTSIYLSQVHGQKPRSVFLLFLALSL